MAPLLVVDAPSLMFRAFHALPDSIADARGRPVNALLGTTNLLLYAIEERRPRATVLCFGQDAAAYRTEAYPPYHADRVVMPDGLGHQFAEAGDFFGAFGFEVAHTEDLEADDLLGSYAAAEVDAGGEALLMTGDRDMFQCAGERVGVLYVRTGTRGFEDVGPDEVVARYGVTPDLVPDFIALRGDPSDGLPGARGIGEKTAADLLRRHGSLEAAIAGALRERPGIRGALYEQADELRRFKEIATLRRVPVEPPPDREVDHAGGAQAARALDMNRLAERLERLAA
ncbi:MAG: 5'-3' exonuclease [Actinomycetota bacterium]|nr:5'-3' exonuclease [Actinomycetota bacterium]